MIKNTPNDPAKWPPFQLRGWPHFHLPKSYEGAYGDLHNYTASSLPDRQGKVELLKLRNRSADHSGADALIYIPANFDSSKPIKLVVYNHGLDLDVSEAFQYSQLKSQIDQADPNTVLIMPEWQAQPQSRNGSTGKFLDNGFFSNMLMEVMHKTPQLAGKTLDDVENISVFTHSGGFNAAAAEIYRNGLESKVTSVTLLDSLYRGGQFDRWIEDHIFDLASGRMHFNNIFGASTNKNSRAAAGRIERMLKSARLPMETIREDFDGRTVMSGEEMANYGIVFKRSDIRIGDRNAHYSVTNIYPGEVLRTQNYYALQEQSDPVAPLQGGFFQ